MSDCTTGDCGNCSDCRSISQGYTVKKEALVTAPCAECTAKDAETHRSLLRLIIAFESAFCVRLTHPCAVDDMIKVIRNFGDKVLKEAPPSNKLKLDYLRKQAKLNRDCAETAAKEAAQTGDPEQWDGSRLMLGQAMAYEEMVAHMRGLNSGQEGAAKRKGVL